MSNPLRGEADLGDKQIVVNFNNLCKAEAALGLKVPALVAAIQTEGLGFDDVRRLLKALLVGGAGMTLDQVGDFIDVVGMEAVGEAIGKAFIAFFPKAEEETENPLKAG